MKNITAWLLTAAVALSGAAFAQGKSAEGTKKATKTTATWWGHAAWIVETPGGARIAIDPWLSNPTAPKDLKWPEQLDAILITHGHFDHVGDLERAHHPVGELHADLAGAEDGTEGLLHDQAQPPGRQQRVERPRIEVAYQQPFGRQASGPGDDEGDRHGDEEVAGIGGRQIRLENVRRHVGHVGAEDHELPVRHVDHAHLAEDDGEPQRHQHEHREKNEAGEALHGKNGRQIAVGISE